MWKQGTLGHVLCKGTGACGTRKRLLVRRTTTVRQSGDKGEIACAENCRRVCGCGGRLCTVSRMAVGKGTACMCEAAGWCVKRCRRGYRGPCLHVAGQELLVPLPPQGAACTLCQRWSPLAAEPRGVAACIHTSSAGCAQGSAWATAAGQHTGSVGASFLGFGGLKLQEREMESRLLLENECGA
jgi:hypothetical protein